MNKIRVAVFAQHQTRPRLLELLQPHADIQPSVLTASVQDLWQGIVQHDPQVVLVETHPELADTISLIKQIQSHHLEIRCVVLAHRLDMGHVRQAVDVGAMGYLLIEPEVDDLATPIRLVFSGKFTCSPEIARLLASTG